MLENCWRLEGSYLVTRVLDCDTYEVDLGRCNTAREFLGWCKHLSEKTWVTSKVLGDFVTAVDACLGLRNLAVAPVDVEASLQNRHRAQQLIEEAMKDAFTT
jgi:hypothetical protein